MDLLVDEQARGRPARLALEAQVHPPNDPVDRIVEVGVRKHDDRVLAAELERDRLHRDLRRADLDPPTRLGEADEGEPAHERMSHERVPDLGAEPGQDVHDARREDALELLRKTKRRERRVLGRLEHEGVARHERRAELHRREEQRVVEGDDPTDDAEGLTERVVEAVVAGRDRLAPRLQCEPGEVAQLGGADLDVDAQVAHRAAVVGGVELRQLLLALDERVGQLEQQPGALLCRGRAPRREGGLGRLDGHGDVLGTTARDVREQLARRGVARVDRLAARRVAKVAADEDGHGPDCRLGRIGDVHFDSTCFAPALTVASEPRPRRQPRPTRPDPVASAPARRVRPQGGARGRSGPCARSG